MEGGEVLGGAVGLLQGNNIVLVDDVLEDAQFSRSLFLAGGHGREKSPSVPCAHLEALVHEEAEVGDARDPVQRPAR